MGADAEMAGHLVGGEHHADGETAAQALGVGQDVRRDAIVHVGEQLAGTAQAGLHLVEDQQRAVLIAQLARAFQIRLVRRQHTAFALDRLQHHGAGLVGNGRFQRRQVVIGDMFDAFDLRAETIGILRLAADRNGEQRAAVEAVDR